MDGSRSARGRARFIIRDCEIDPWLAPPTTQVGRFTQRQYLIGTKQFKTAKDGAEFYRLAISFRSAASGDERARLCRFDLGDSSAGSANNEAWGYDVVRGGRPAIEPFEQ